MANSFLIGCISVFYGVLVAVKSFIRFCQVGSKFFYVKPRDEIPKCLQDPALGTHGNLKLNDVTLHYVINGDPDKPLMLLIHGFPDFWYSWKHQLKEFAKEYCVVAVDLRGYGSSEKKKNLKDYAVPRMVDDLHNVIQHFSGDSGSAVVVSHDWGGILSYYLAATYPKDVKRLIVANAPHPKAFTKARATWKQFLMSWYIFYFQLPKLPEITLAAEDFAFFNRIFTSGGKKLLSDEEMEAYKYTYSRPGAPTHAINYYRANFLGSSKSTKQQDDLRVTCPTLLIWGDGDIALSMESAVYSSMFVDNFNLRIMKGACHWSQLDRPEEFNSHMRTFLKNNQ